MSIKNPVTLTPTQEAILAKIAEVVKIVWRADSRYRDHSDRDGNRELYSQDRAVFLRKRD